MTKDKIVFVNGRAYDHATGMPVNNIKAKKTFDVKIKTKTISNQPVVNQSMNKAKNSRVMDIARSKSISHFAPNKTKTNNLSSAAKAKKTLDVGPVRHPIASKVNRSLSSPIQKKPEPKTAKQVKDAAIQKALGQKPSPQPKANLKRKLSQKQKLAILLCSGALAVVGLVYTAYLFLPSLSVRVASAQAGIDAKYPEYKPDGYRVDGPVSYNDKEVIINFKANAGQSGFSIKQARSSWDSSALREKVEKDSKGNFNTTSVNGLTIYTHGSTSMWVSGGILFTIAGNADLLSDQIHRIAISL